MRRAQGFSQHQQRKDKVGEGTFGPTRWPVVVWDAPQTSSTTPLEPDSYLKECTPEDDNHPEEVSHENGNVINVGAASTCQNKRDVAH